jgi:hypothetical protein
MMGARAPKSGTKLRAFPFEGGDLDELLVERIRVFYAQVASHLRELEAYKLERGKCIGGISCTRDAVEGPSGGHRDCAHHTAARKAGIKLARWTAYDSEYGRLRKREIAQQKEEKKREAEEVKAKAKRPAATKKKAAA